MQTEGASAAHEDIGFVVLGHSISQSFRLFEDSPERVDGSPGSAKTKRETWKIHFNNRETSPASVGKG